MLTEAARKGIAVLPRLDKKKGKVRGRSETSKELFEVRKEKCKEVADEYGSGSLEWIAMHRNFRKRISKSCRDDYRRWIRSLIKDVRDAEVLGKSSDVTKGFPVLAGTKCNKKKPPRNKTTGVVFAGPDELAQAWADFARRNLQRRH